MMWWGSAARTGLRGGQQEALEHWGSCNTLSFLTPKFYMQFFPNEQTTLLDHWLVDLRQ